MKIKIEKSYVNCYYIMLISIFSMGYITRSSILPGAIGYVNIIFYICMSIILMRWIRCINRNIIVVSIIFGIVLCIDLSTTLDIYKSITSLLGFVLPLLLFCIDYKKIIMDKEKFVVKCIKIINFFAIIVFVYMIVDLFSSSALTKSLSTFFFKLESIIPKRTGFLQFRAGSYLGHALYTKHFILMFYILNMIYYIITSKYLMNIIVVHIISMVGIALTGSKLGIMAILFLILYYNSKNKNRIINFAIIFLGLLILGYLGVFDIVINRFMTTTFTTNRVAAGELVSSALPGIKLVGGFGVNLSDYLLKRFNSSEVTAAMEYPFKIWVYRYGLIATALILYEIYISTLYRFVKSRNVIFIISFLIIIAETSAFNQLVYNPDLFILIILWNIILNNMLDLYEEQIIEKENEIYNINCGEN